MLNTITKIVHRSKSTLSVKVSETVINVLNEVKRLGRNSVSIQDIAFVINNNVYKHEQITEKQVQTVMKKLATDYAKGYKYNNLRNDITPANLDGYFFTI